MDDASLVRMVVPVGINWFLNRTSLNQALFELEQCKKLCFNYTLNVSLDLLGSLFLQNPYCERKFECFDDHLCNNALEISITS